MSDTEKPDDLAEEATRLGLPPGATLEEIQLAKLHAVHPPAPQAYSDEFLGNMVRWVGALE